MIELDIKDPRVEMIQKQLVKGSIVNKVFRDKDGRSKYEVHYFDPKNGFCRSYFAAHNYKKGL